MNFFLFFKRSAAAAATVAISTAIPPGGAHIYSLFLFPGLSPLLSRSTLLLLLVAQWSCSPSPPSPPRHHRRHGCWIYRIALRARSTHRPFPPLCVCISIHTYSNYINPYHTWHLHCNFWFSAPFEVNDYVGGGVKTTPIFGDRIKLHCCCVCVDATSKCFVGN